MDLAKIKRFYIETWWLWSLYFILGILAVIFVHWVSLPPFQSLVSYRSTLRLSAGQVSSYQQISHQKNSGVKTDG